MLENRITLFDVNNILCGFFVFGSQNPGKILKEFQVHRLTVQTPVEIILNNNFYTIGRHWKKKILIFKN